MRSRDGANDVLGGEAQPAEFSTRLGHSYYLDFADVAHDFITVGVAVRPWKREHRGVRLVGLVRAP
jgi:hypothetical protein